MVDNDLLKREINEWLRKNAEKISTEVITEHLKKKFLSKLLIFKKSATKLVKKPFFCSEKPSKFIPSKHLEQ